MSRRCLIGAALPIATEQILGSNTNLGSASGRIDAQNLGSVATAFRAMSRR
jgi:hypothetical protein